MPSPRRRHAATLWLLGAVTLGGGPAWAADSDAPDVIARLAPAVVSISVETRTQPRSTLGNLTNMPVIPGQTLASSGFFITSSGLIVTNEHSVERAGTITVKLGDFTRLTACVVARAAQSDLALLRVYAGRPVPTLRFGNSDRLRQGDRVFIIGNPLGLGSTVTGGIVSARHRVTPDSLFGSFLQVDASLNHGSSGAPVVDAAGEVVGVATELVSAPGETGSVGLGLAIPSDDARLVVDQLRRDGQVRLGWIGAHVQPMTQDIATAVKLPGGAGAIVTDMVDGGPAVRAGLRVGDIILSAAGHADLDVAALNRLIAATAAGQQVRLGIWRGGQREGVAVDVADSPADRTAPALPPTVMCGAAPLDDADLGLRLGPLMDDVRAGLRLDAHTGGVLVTDVLPGSSAALHAVGAGAVIENVDEHPVGVPADVQAGIAAARAAGHGFVLILIRSAEGLRWVALPLRADAD